MSNLVAMPRIDTLQLKLTSPSSCFGLAAMLGLASRSFGRHSGESRISTIRNVRKVRPKWISRCSGDDSAG